jgi:hypothetical protein
MQSSKPLMQRGQAGLTPFPFHEDNPHHMIGYSSPTMPAAYALSGSSKLRSDGWRASSVKVGPKRRTLKGL